MSRERLDVLTSRRSRESIWLVAIPLVALWSLRFGIEPRLGVLAEGSIVLGAAGMVLLLLRRRRRGLAVILAACLPFAPLVISWIVGSLSGQVPALEMTLLAMLGGGILALAVCAVRRREASLAVISSGFLTLFVTFTAEQASAVLIPLGWIALCLWHLVTNHWERLDVCMPVNIRRSPWIRPAAVLGGLILAGFGGAAAHGRFQTFFQGAQLAPTSGGSRWTEVSARSGIGSGDLAVAAKNNAQSFGAVDSDILLESHETSLYDMFSEVLGDPFVNREYERRQALQGTVDGANHAHLSQTDDSSSSFSVARNPPRSSQGRLKNAKGKDVLQWVGPSGIRLALNRYKSFDGKQWRGAEGAERPAALPQRADGEMTWFLDPRRPVDGIFQGSDLHTLRVLRLDSARIATPMMAAAVHIQDVTESDLIDLGPDDCWYMPGRRQVPPLTLIHLLSESVLEDDLLADHAFTKPSVASDDTGSPLSRGRARARLLARQWTEQLQSPYEKINRIVAKLQEHFTLDRTSGSASDDPLDDFLTAGRGGEYLFATAAAEMLASVGLKSRLVTGFYVSPDRYDRASRHTSILREDVHTWVEVQLSDGRWIEVEASPGYRPPNFLPSWSLYLRRTAVAAVPHATFFGFLFTTLAFTRRIWVNQLVTLYWWFQCRRGHRRGLRATIRTLEIRAALARRPRSRGTNPRDWLTAVAQTNPELLPSVHHFCDSAERFFFGQLELVDDWRAAAERLVRGMNVSFFLLPDPVSSQTDRRTLP